MNDIYSANIAHPAPLRSVFYSHGTRVTRDFHLTDASIDAQYLGIILKDSSHQIRSFLDY